VSAVNKRSQDGSSPPSEFSPSEFPLRASTIDRADNTYLTLKSLPFVS
jgi:hypothetical protein